MHKKAHNWVLFFNPFRMCQLQTLAHMMHFPIFYLGYALTLKSEGNTILFDGNVPTVGMKKSFRFE